MSVKMIIYAKQNGAQMATFAATGTRADIDDLGRQWRPWERGWDLSPVLELSRIHFLIDLLAILGKNLNRTMLGYNLKNFRMCIMVAEPLTPLDRNSRIKLYKNNARPRLFCKIAKRPINHKHIFVCLQENQLARLKKFRLKKLHLL